MGKSPSPFLTTVFWPSHPPLSTLDFQPSVHKPNYLFLLLYCTYSSKKNNIPPKNVVFKTYMAKNMFLLSFWLRFIEITLVAWVFGRKSAWVFSWLEFFSPWVFWLPWKKKSLWTYCLKEENNWRVGFFQEDYPLDARPWDYHFQTEVVSHLYK